MTALTIFAGLFVVVLMLRNLAALCYALTPQYKLEQRMKRYL